MKTTTSFQPFRFLTLCAAAGLALAAMPPQAMAEPAPASTSVQPAAALTGKWRTNGTFRLYLNGPLVMGGDAPTWITFNSDGSVTADREAWPVGWRNSGGRPQLTLDTKVARRELGEVSSIRYAKRSLTVSGKSISGNFDCSFRVRGISARFIWKFSGRR